MVTLTRGGVCLTIQRIEKKKTNDNVAVDLLCIYFGKNVVIILNASYGKCWAKCSKAYVHILLNETEIMNNKSRPSIKIIISFTTIIRRVYSCMDNVIIGAQPIDVTHS